MMIAQKRRPSFCRLRISRGFPHPTQHRSLRDIEAKHLQFTMNAWHTPGRVLGNHAENETAQFPVDTPSSHTDSMSRKPSPIQLEPCSVPANNGFRLDQDQHPLPFRPEPPQDHSKQFVRSGKPWLRMLLFQNCELLPKSKVFQEQIAARVKESGCKYGQKSRQAQHEISFTRTHAKVISQLVSMIRRQIGILASHK
jgi:hypothetical protein